MADAVEHIDGQAQRRIRIAYPEQKAGRIGVDQSRDELGTLDPRVAGRSPAREEKDSRYTNSPR
jgi:hypothetical protein